ncbi:hypothetical protein COCSUDRAFT_61842 [Coccomyxa subellipsoidea C-169]|uniref:Uncharacterized protein n=1 Tax=Coccomyxa subellipsoidea (strain C-169) TaxID=574566 RepID=I0Z198_COCSC|nr:hypothetical protein COCSUDRAFT_61842 [Coccomyxa subellipsoidea C-169]EIE24417.1 hypothetical protein COCSUDRAFT_61842 [Coccomyxa subellipsoidea C-169]|eukprot:XP_005648961.1 hypothetical protein COCSUDRAFT_61842 [Coccomyxa subellipsoidea C-169]
MTFLQTVDDKPGLCAQGRVRAAHIPKVFGKGRTALDTYNSPNIIYAMKQKKITSSRRPFDTLVPLAVELGMDPVMGGRTGDHGENDLHDNILKHAEDSYVGKTILMCWEHKAIPKIVHEIGLTDEELTWGLDPFSGVDERANFTAIWVFTPALANDPEQYFKVYKMFDMVPNHCNAEGKCPPDDDCIVANALYVPEPPNGPYKTRVL